MSKIKTIGTIFASLALGAAAVLVSSPQKTTKSKTVKVADSRKEQAEDQNLFI